MTNPSSHGAPQPTAAAGVAAWAKFVARALQKRLDPDRFAALVPVHFSEHPALPPVITADILLRPTPDAHETLDSRAVQYLMVLLDQRLVDLPAVLRALYKYTSAHARVPPPPDEAGQLEGAAAEKEGVEAENGKKKGKGKQTQKQHQQILRWRNSYNGEVAVLVRLASMLSKGTARLTPRHVVQMLKVLERWMVLLVEAAAAISREAFGALGMVKDETERARGALARFLVAVGENQTVVTTLARPECKGICKLLDDALQSFVPLEMQRAPEVTARLERFRTETLAKNLPVSKKDAAEPTSLVDNLVSPDSVQVPEGPIVNSRAGLYIYLSAALVGRPMLDDDALFAYLRNRYQHDVQTAAIQLILASFDLLANAVFRNEGPRTGHLLKSFVVNKVPLILVSLAGMSSMYPFNAEHCITQALGQVDPNVFPTLSGLFDMSNTSSSFQDSVRQDFCFACQLHGLLSEAAVESLVGDITWQSLPDEGRYKKDDLVAACLQDSHRAQKLIAELENMNGNVGAVAQALVEIMASLCRNKETMTLKPLCSQLAAKPLSLDVLLLFERPHKILQPLWELLDGWTGYEEDQGEYQPVFEEFGSILLLLLAIVYRYNLSAADLGIRSPTSFVGRLLNGGDLWKPQEELTEQENAHLSGWVLGLFNTEAGGLGDDLMASCPPQDFYLLMPTLFHQIVVAMYTGHLTDEVLKGGLEYLVGVLLLPSMVPALLHISNRLFVAGPLQPIIVKVLQHIILPTSISEEASTMLSAVLNIVAKPLDSALRYYQRQDPQCQEIEPLLRAIRDNVALSRRTGAADHNELESWGSMQITSGGATHVGMSAAVRHTVQGLVQWAHGPSLNGMPAAYTHRQTLAATQLLGAPRHLAALLDELKTFHNTPHEGVAYDVVTAILCAPDVRSGEDLSAATPSSSSSPDNAEPRPPPSRRAGSPSLRQFLKWEAEDWARTRRSDPLLADTAVRLHRRVEAQMVPPTGPADVDAAAAVAAAAAMLQPELAGALGGDVALNDAIAAAVSAGEHGDGMVLDAADLGTLGQEMSAGGGGTGGGAGGAGGGEGGDGSIFGGLGGAGEFAADFASWEMDLEG
ncbi:hypothetical protein VTJ49DRAFT_4470 [Mycothermus thermophilus]|uniref:Mediator of RNA polymerase II transcription subunit 5 n=1 Tax=Humicola insolens TaxID=85995 RepID=A0ABR3VLQ7_HUMIN